MPADRRTALVTGGGGLIGRAVCARLAATGAAVVVAEHPGAEAAARETADQLLRAGATARVELADVADPDAVNRMCANVVAALGSVDIVVNNAAVTQVHGPWGQIPEAEWDDVMATNVKGVHLVCRAAAEHMTRRGWGRIVNIGSVTFLTGQENLAHYVASKGGVIGLTRVLARVLGRHGITVNTVSPGAIESPAERLDPDVEAVQRLLAAQAIQRRGQPEDIAAAVAFLAGEDAGFITGQMLLVDGGWALH